MTTTAKQEIKTATATIKILSDTSFEIDDSPQDGQGQDPLCTYGPYYVNDTDDLGSIKAILDNPKWTEDEINAAVAELSRDKEQEHRDYLDDLDNDILRQKDLDAEGL